MNHHAKRYMRDLECLGFVRDYDAQTKGIAYRHPNDPEQILKVFDAMTDNSITSGIRKANKIADTGWSGPAKPASIKERANVTRRKDTQAQKREAEAVQQRADAKEREIEQQDRLTSRDREMRNIGSLMQPGHGR